MSVALVTDSSSMLPASLREKYDVGVVPLVVLLGGAEHHEGVDLTTADFYEQLASGAAVGTAAPSPGEIRAVYEAALSRPGVDSVLAVHVGSNLSATISAAQVAALGMDDAVEIVDSGTTSFALGCCVWAAGEALAAGADGAEAAQAARRIGAAVRTVFVIGVSDLAVRSGRYDPGIDLTGPGQPIIATGPGSEFEQPGIAHDTGEAVATMAGYLEKTGDQLRLRVGVGDAAAPELGRALAHRLDALECVHELVRYEVGPSVGAHMGARTVGAVWHPL